MGLAIAVVMVGCAQGAAPQSTSGGDPPNENTLLDDSALEFGVDPDFVSAVLADEVVTFEEFVMTIQQKYRCMVEAGVEGRVAHDPSLSFDGPSELSHASSERLGAVSRGCSQSVQLILMTYLRDNPYDSQEIIARSRDRVLACIGERAPSIYADLSTDWDLRALRDWIFDANVNGGYPPVEAVEATDCLNASGAPWRSLREAAGLE